MVNGIAMKKCVEKKRKGFSLPEILVACAIMVTQAKYTRVCPQGEDDESFF